MKKSIQFIIVMVLLVACSGCFFPVVVPGEGGKHGGHHDEGRHGGHR